MPHIHITNIIQNLHQRIDRGMQNLRQVLDRGRQNLRQGRDRGMQNLRHGCDRAQTIIRSMYNTTVQPWKNTIETVVMVVLFYLLIMSQLRADCFFNGIKRK